MTVSAEPLPLDFYDREPHDLARALLGHDIVRSLPDGEQLRARIVELEVYGGIHDPASHSAQGPPTDRNRAMFGPPGTAYVYQIYGMYFCFNVVGPNLERPSALLVRAARPLGDQRSMARRRGLIDADASDPDWDERNLMSGPGKLCQAMDIDLQHDGASLSESGVIVVHGAPALEAPSRSIETSPRIGLNPETVGEAVEWEWRYTVAESEFLSR